MSNINFNLKYKVINENISNFINYLKTDINKCSLHELRERINNLKEVISILEKNDSFWCDPVKLVTITGDASITVPHLALLSSNFFQTMILKHFTESNESTFQIPQEYSEGAKAILFPYLRMEHPDKNLDAETIWQGMQLIDFYDWNCIAKEIEKDYSATFAQLTEDRELDIFYELFHTQIFPETYCTMIQTLAPQWDVQIVNGRIDFTPITTDNVPIRLQEITPLLQRLDELGIPTGFDFSEINTNILEKENILNAVSKLHLYNFRHLDISNWNIGIADPADITKICATLSAFTTLTSLNISANHLGLRPNIATKICDAISKITGLQWLDIHNNCLGRYLGSANDACTLLAQLTQLQHLEMGWNDIDIHQGAALDACIPISTMPSLQRLNMNENSLGLHKGAGPASCEQIVKTPNLKTLYLQYNDFDTHSDDAADVFQVLTQCLHLELL